jgi:hypothetical protein
MPGKDLYSDGDSLKHTEHLLDGELKIRKKIKCDYSLSDRQRALVMQQVETRVGKSLDQELLTKVALEGRTDLRNAAVEKLFDQALLAKVALESTDSDLRVAAVEKLFNQALLAKIVLDSKPSWGSRFVLFAIRKLVDQNLLARVAVESTDFNLRIAAVQTISDQGLLAKFALESEDSYIRKTAVNKLLDYALLAKIAVTDKDLHVRSAAQTRMPKVPSEEAKARIDELLQKVLAFTQPIPFWRRREKKYLSISSCRELEGFLDTAPSLFSNRTLEQLMWRDISLKEDEWQLGGAGSPDQCLGVDSYANSVMKERAARELNRRREPSQIVNPRFCTACGKRLPRAGRFCVCCGKPISL